MLVCVDLPHSLEQWLREVFYCMEGLIYLTIPFFMDI